MQQLQNNQISRQLQVPTSNLIAGTNAPELYRGESTDVGPQRILRLNPKHLYFDLVFDSQVFFSDNANYAQAPFSIASSVFVNTVQAAFAPPASPLGTGKIAYAIGVASQWYNYGDNRLAPLDFNAQTVFASSKYSLDKWQLGVGVNLTRLVNQGDYSETYREFMPNFGVQRVIPLNDQMFFSVGDLVDYHLTEVPSVAGSRTDINDRLDNVASLTFTWQATRHLIFQPYYRFQYSYYQHNTLADQRPERLPAQSRTHGGLLFQPERQPARLRQLQPQAVGRPVHACLPRNERRHWRLAGHQILKAVKFKRLISRRQTRSAVALWHLK